MGATRPQTTQQHPGIMLYHEKQVAALCGVHCINTLLQGPYVTELDLAQIGHELDQLERQMLDDAAGGPSTNLDESGMFSVQVLTKALQVWGLSIVPVDSQELKAAGFDPQQEEAFVCNLQEHWFSIRRVQGEFWNFNSLYVAPEKLSAFYLTGYLDTLKAEGYTIFVVRGPLPEAMGPQGELEGPGKWWAVDEAQAAHQAAQSTRAAGRARNVMEAALARAAAGGGAITLRSSGAKRRAGSEDEDADLAAAIAASMSDHAGPSGSTPAAAAAGAAAAAPPGTFSYAAAVRQRDPSSAGGSAGGGAGSSGDFGGGRGMSFDEEDPELAAALAASLEEHHNSSQQQQQQDGGQEGQEQPSEQHETQADADVPEEPAEGGDGVLTVAFRLPSGARLSRRFREGDSVGGAAAFVARQLRAGGELATGQRVALSTQFPQKELADAGAQLGDVGVADRDILTVSLVKG